MVNLRDAIEGFIRFLLILTERAIKGLLLFVRSPAIASVYILRSRISQDIDYRIVCLVYLATGLTLLIFASKVFSVSEYENIAMQIADGFKYALLALFVYTGLFAVSAVFPSSLAALGRFRRSTSQRLIFISLSICFMLFGVLYFFLSRFFDPSVFVIYSHPVQLLYLTNFTWVILFMNAVLAVWIFRFLWAVIISRSRLVLSIAGTLVGLTSLSVIVFFVSEIIAADEYGPDVFRRSAVSLDEANFACFVRYESHEKAAVTILFQNMSHAYAELPEQNFNVYDEAFFDKPRTLSNWTFALSADEIRDSGGVLLKPLETRLLNKVVPRDANTDPRSFRGGGCGRLSIAAAAS